MATLKIPKADSTPEELAVFARLRYVCDQDRGYTRLRNGVGFRYIDGERRLRDAKRIARIAALAIPPAWRDVWICRLANGHLQATGRDSRKRKQYLYHERWQEISNLAKFSRLAAFGDLLPKIRRAIARDLAGRKLTRRRVLAGVVGLLDATSARIGNEEYVTQNGSYGLASLRDRHVTVTGKTLELRFVAKGGFRMQRAVESPALARLVKQARSVPGARLFQYEDEAGGRRAITAQDANDYLRELTGESFTAKDFRTWKASALAAGLLYAERDVDSAARRRRVLKDVIDQTAEALGNTPTICRKYYLHPGLATAWLDGSFAKCFRGFATTRRKGFLPAEQVLARFLKRWQPI
jgi:DNA topoisomerase I